MAKEEQIITLLAQLRQAPPSRHMQSIDSSTAGMRAILLYLAEREEVVTAGMISDNMGVSTARVAALLKKMEAKGLIERNRDHEDARKVIVSLSERGRKVADQVHEHIHAHVEAMIDKIGMERMMEFAVISKEISSIMEPPDIEI